MGAASTAPALQDQHTPYKKGLDEFQIMGANPPPPVRDYGGSLLFAFGVSCAHLLPDSHRNQKMKMTLKRAFGFTAFSLLMQCVVPCLQADCKTNQSTAPFLERLQGKWKTQDGITITFTGNSLHYHHSTNDWHKGTFTLPAGTNPQELRLTLTDSSLTNGPGALIRASMRIEDVTLTLAPSGNGEGEPPRSFEEKNNSIYKLRKVQPQQKNVEPSKSKWTGNA